MIKALSSARHAERGHYHLPCGQLYCWRPGQYGVSALFCCPAIGKAICRCLHRVEALLNIFFSAAQGMGPDRWGLQMDGMGGGVTSNNKVCVVEHQLHLRRNL